MSDHGFVTYDVATKEFLAMCLQHGLVGGSANKSLAEKDAEIHLRNWHYRETQPAQVNE